MITERMNPRQTMLIWLGNLHRKAVDEKAEHTAEEIESLAEPMLAMSAASEAAEPSKMRTLIEGERYPASVQKYLVRNWALITGLPPRDPAEMEHHKTAVEQAASEAVRRLTDHASAARPDTLEKIVQITGQVAKVLSGIPGESAKMHGDGTAILLREAIGLPGDEGVALMIGDDRVVLNAALAMRKLGAEIDLTPFADRAGVVHQGRLSDWRAEGDIGTSEAPISDPVAFMVKDLGTSIDIFMGGAETNGTLPGQSSIRVEREADTTRFMIYDANCDAPRVFGVKDGEPLAELPNDWQHTLREPEEDPSPS
ncbi:hypothetical protein [Paracoccus sp. ME4]|uniref:hypothetical protein n=1 Tax=Paracoccus sp. ME4 TaxID=3138066 RepID=UPI00398B091A